MSEIHAAMGLSNLPHVREIIRQNRANHQQYENELKSIAGVKLACAVSGTATSNYQYVVCHIDKNQCGLSADEMAQQVIFAVIVSID